MFNFEVPKEIKAKVKLLGLELKEWAIIGIIVVFSLSVFSDMIHKIFVIPFYIVIALSIIFLFSPSDSNPQRKNYHTVYYFIKRIRGGYVSINVNSTRNQTLKKIVEASNQEKIEEISNRESISSEVESPLNQVEFKDGSYHFIDHALDENEVDDAEDEDLELESFNATVESRDDKKVNVDNSEDQGDKPITLDVDGHLEQNNLRNRKEDIDEIDISDELIVKSRKERMVNRKVNLSSGVTKIIVALSILFVLVSGAFLFTYMDGSFLAKDKVVEETVDEETLVSALRSFSLKDYDEAMNLFNEIDYELLDEDDKDVMLLTYLFADNPKVALELEPDFDEVVVSYYKASHSMQKIVDLQEDVDSKVIDFEVAVNEGDYEKIVELKDFVQIKDDRGEKIVEAFIELGQLDEAKEFVEDLDDENEKSELSLKVEEIEKKNNKKKKKGDK